MTSAPYRFPRGLTTPPCALSSGPPCTNQEPPARPRLRLRPRSQPAELLLACLTAIQYAAAVHWIEFDATRLFHPLQTRPVPPVAGRRRIAPGTRTLHCRRHRFLHRTRSRVRENIELLYAAGDPGEIELACEDLKMGWQDEQALHVHRSLLDDLPPVLRAYVGCAGTLFGDLAQADVIKLHKASGKVTFLVYDDFDGKPLPELRQRIKVNLRTRWVQVFDHSAEQQLLYFKERFLSPDHPRRPDMEAFSAKLRKLGFDEATIGRGPLPVVSGQSSVVRGQRKAIGTWTLGVGCSKLDVPETPTLTVQCKASANERRAEAVKVRPRSELSPR